MRNQNNKLIVAKVDRETISPILPAHIKNYLIDIDGEFTHLMEKVNIQVFEE